MTETTPERPMLYAVECIYLVQERCPYSVYADSAEQAKRFAAQQFKDDHKPCCELQSVNVL